MTPPPPPLSPLSSPPLSYQEVRRACSPAPSRRAGNSRASGSSGLDDPRSAMPTYPPFPSLLAAPRLPSLVRQSDGPARLRRLAAESPAPSRRAGDGRASTVGDDPDSAMRPPPPPPLSPLLASPVSGSSGNTTGLRRLPGSLATSRQRPGFPSGRRKYTFCPVTTPADSDSTAHCRLQPGLIHFECCCPLSQARNRLCV